MEIFLGVDIGQRADYSTLVAVERARFGEGKRNLVTYEWEPSEDVRLGVVKAERIPLGTPYPEVARRVAAVAKWCGTRGKTLLAVDVTGVGAGVVDLLREQDLGQAWLLPVMITGGYRRHFEGGRYHVPKPDLVDGLVRAMQLGQVYAAEGVALGPLVEEMNEFGVRLGTRGQERFEGKKDDLVTGLCLAVWAAGMATMGD